MNIKRKLKEKNSMMDIKRLENDILKLYNMILHASSKSMGKQYLLDINMLLNLYGELGYDIYELIPEFHINNYIVSLQNKESKRIINDFIRQFDNNESFINDITSNYIEIIRNNNDLTIQEKKRRSFSLKDSKEILYDFLASLNDEYYKYAKQLFDENRILFNELYDAEGTCYYSNILQSEYIIINKNNDKLTVEELSFLAHEIGHGIANRILKNKNYHQGILLISNNMLEVPSTFFENMFVEYALKTKLDQSVDACFYRKLDFFINNIIDLSILNHLDHFEMNENYQTNIDSTTYNNICDKIDVDNNDTSDSFLLNVRDIIIYTYGYILSLEFMEMYKIDKKEAMKNFNNFIQSISLMDNLELLNNFGLDKNDIVKGKTFEKVLKKRINN